MNRAASTFKEALEFAIPIGSDHIYQIGYFAPDLDAMIESYGPMGSHGWHKFRRTERFVIYPGNQVTGVFYVAHHHDYMPGFETELVQPLTDPNYISMLDLTGGQIAHLGVKAERFGNVDDVKIIRRLTGRIGQAIQSGRVRAGGLSSDMFKEEYTIYQVEEFLPVKIVRQV